eukprot:5509645-Pleurochrysis_carterae.AAC.1
MKVEGGCGRESHVDRNLRATTRGGQRRVRLGGCAAHLSGAHASWNLSPNTGNLEKATGSPRSPPARPRRRPRRSRGGGTALINSNYYALAIDERYLYQVVPIVSGTAESI